MRQMNLQGEANHGYGSSESLPVGINEREVAPPQLVHVNMFDPDVRPIPPQRKSRTVVHVENANKIYGSGKKGHHVLKDLCMAVQEHTIYGLLGASGCGKTTILSCIVALRKLDSGTILICGEPTGTPRSGIPGKKVGYMPQEAAMNGEFTVVEVLAYFGRIYAMSRDEIKKRTEELSNLLDLKGLTQRIDGLSEGQKRRVSMAVSLIHQPDLLILDEPTVGLDPLLRDSIWKYLHELVAQNTTTIIVTTHYIEEMRNADRIGIMRSGRLLCEDSPSQLLQIYNENLLDTVVVKLCKQDEGPSGGTNGVLGPFARGAARPNAASINALPATAHLRRPVNTAASIHAEWAMSGGGRKGAQARTKSWNRMHALLLKDLLVMIRNWFFLIVLICVPALAVSIVCIVLSSNPKDLKVGVVNYEMDYGCSADPQPWVLGSGSADKNGSIATGKQACLIPPTELSCAFLKALDTKTIKLIEYDTVEDAEEDALAAELFGYFYFQEDFSTHFFKRVVLNDLSDNETLSGSKIQVHLDMLSETGQFLQNLFIEAYQKMSGRLLVHCGIDESFNRLPVHFGEPIFSSGKSESESKEPRRLEFMGTGLTIAYAFFFCALQCGLTYIIEKKDGMLNRTMVAGVARLEIMASQFIVQLTLMSLSQIVVCFFLIFVIFNKTSDGPMVVGFLLCVVNSISGMSLGFLLATFCSDEKYAMLMAMGFVFPNFMMSGLFCPFETLPKVFRMLGTVMPTTISTRAFQSITVRGMGITDEIVWMGFVTAVGWAVCIWLIILVWHKIGQR